MWINETELRKKFEEKNWNLSVRYHQQRSIIKSLDVQEYKTLDQYEVEAVVYPYLQHVQLTLDSESGNMLHFSCECPFCKNDESACAHIGAVMLFLQEKQIESFPYRYRENSADFVQQMRRRLLFSESEQLIESYISTAVVDDPTLLQQEPIGLIPEVIFSNSELLISFRIGRKKKYIMKNIGEFLERMKQGAIATYGKELYFIHCRESFDAFSQQILHFLRRNEAFQPSLHNPRYLKLTGSCIDDFYDLFVNQLIGLADGRNLVMVHEEPQFRLNVEAYEQDYQLKITPQEFRYLAGSQYDYLYLSGTLIRMSERYQLLCGPLLKKLQHNGTLLISQDQIKNFYYNVLLPVEEFAEVVGSEELPIRLDPLLSKAYVDEPSPHVITISLQFCYGEHIYLGFDTQTNRENRNLRQEQKIRTLVQQYVTRIDNESQLAWIENNETREFGFLAEGIGKLMELAEVYICDSLRNIQIRSRSSFSVGVRMDAGLLQLDLKSEEFSKEELAQIFQQYKMKKKYVRLKNGDYFALGDDQAEEVFSLLETLHINEKQLLQDKIEIPTFRSLALNEKLMESSDLKVERDEQFKTMIRDFKNIGESQFPVPANLKNILRNYQKEGFRWLKTMTHYGFGGILADDMGIGKTIQMIALLEDTKLNQQEKCCSLIVTPASLILNWQAEIKKFSPDLSCVCVHGSMKERKDAVSRWKDMDVLITSYDYLKRDLALYEDKRFQFVVLDEAQSIKNQKTRNAQTVKQLHAVHRFALTGTPIENSLAELWSIFDFLMPGYLFNYSYFRESYETPIVRFQEEEQLKTLKKLVSPFILRRVKKDVLKELPEKTETLIQVEFSEDEKKLYQATLQGIQSQLGDTLQQNLGTSKIIVLALLTKLRQLCCDPALIVENYDKQRSKLEACMELVESAVAAKKKILLFSQFTTILDELQQQCKTRDISTYLLTGSTPKQQRFEMMERFNLDQTEVFLISLKAGGTGLNLTGAEIVIHYDPWWNLSAENQATDRAYRIGQKRSVQVYKLIVQGTVEEKIAALQAQKQQLSQSVIEGAENSLSSMSKDEIMALFESDFY